MGCNLSYFEKDDTDQKLLLEDPFIKSIGSFGRWQMKTLFILMLFNLIVSSNLISIIFLEPKPIFYCVDENYDRMALNDSEKCGIACKNPMYDRREFFETASMYFNLKCQEEPKLLYIQTITGVARVFGYFYWGLIIDNKGRAVILKVALILYTISALVITIITNLDIYILLRLASSFFASAIRLSSILIGLELVGSQFRICFVAFVYLGQFLTWVSLLILIYAWDIEWRTVNLLLAFPCLSLLFWRQIPESSRWLVKKGHILDAITLLQSVADYNSEGDDIHMADIQNNVLTISTPDEIPDTSCEIIPKNLQVIIDNPTERCKFYILIGIGLFGGACFQGYEFILLAHTDDLYLAVLSASVGGILGVILSFILNTLFYHRWSMTISTTLNCIGMFICLCAFYEDSKWLNMASHLVVMAGSVSSIITFFVILCELFATEVRATGVGTIISISHLISSFTPLVIFLNPIYWIGSLLVCGILSLLFINLLPRMKYVCMIELIEDTAMFVRYDQSNYYCRRM